MKMGQVVLKGPGERDLKAEVTWYKMGLNVV